MDVLRTKSVLKAARRRLKNAVDYSALLLGPHRGSGKQLRLWILMYHRILPQSDPRYALEEPGMIVQPRTLAMHLEILQRYFTLIPLHEWILRRLNDRTLPTKSCAITFDDGWLDNYQYAFPLLQKYQVPATLFAVSHLVGTRHAFWPTRLARLLQKPREVLQALPWLAPHLNRIRARTLDREALAAVIHAMKAYPDERIQSWLDASGVEQPAESGLANWQQLKEMSASGLVDVGSHTCHHYRLTDELSPQLIQREIAASREKLAAELGVPPTLFCYPNGDAGELARMFVPHYYRAAVTTRRGINTGSRFYPYDLLRIGIHEDRCNTPEKFISRLANWY